MISPRPIDYIGRIRDDFPDLDYFPDDNRLVVERISSPRSATERLSLARIEE